MKLNFKPNLKPLRILLHLPGEAAQDLTFLQRYVAEELKQGTRSNEELLLTIIQRFFEAGDLQFLAWKRGQKNGAVQEKKKQQEEPFQLGGKV
jgi:hypothetical protein